MAAEYIPAGIGIKRIVSLWDLETLEAAGDVVLRPYGDGARSQSLGEASFVIRVVRCVLMSFIWLHAVP
jgi:hypothetical protein